MKKIILTASWFAIAVYCLLSGVDGPAGLKVMAQVEETTAAMHQNIDFLEKLNAEFAMEWAALRNDPGLTAVQGRSLGFIASDEVVVRVALPSIRTNPAFIGERVVYTPAQSLSTSGIRLTALYVWLFLVFSGLTLKLSGGWKWQKSGKTKVQRDIRDQVASRT